MWAHSYAKIWQKKIWKDRQQIAVMSGRSGKRSFNLYFIFFHMIWSCLISISYFLQKKKKNQSKPRADGSWTCTHQLCSWVSIPWLLSAKQGPRFREGADPCLPGPPHVVFAVHYQLLKQQVPSGWSAGTASEGQTGRTQLPVQIIMSASWIAKHFFFFKILKCWGKLHAVSNSLKPLPGEGSELDLGCPEGTLAVASNISF